MIIELTKEINGKKEFDIDVNSLTGADLIKAEKQVRAMGDVSPSVFLSMKFQAVLAAKLMDVTVAELEQLPAVDFRNVVLPVAGFLLGQA